MSKELEALERLRDNIKSNSYFFRGNDYKDYILIGKSLTALEIILKSGLSYNHLLLIRRCDDYETYKIEFDWNKHKLRNEFIKSEEEFKILKNSV